MQLNQRRARNRVKATARLPVPLSSVWILCGLVLGAPAWGFELPGGNPAEQVAAIRAQLDAARNEYIRKLDKASTTAERDELAKEVPQSEPYADLMLRIAGKHPDDPAALDALLWVVGNTRSGTVDSPNAKAKAILLENYADNARLTPLAVALSWSPSAADEDALRHLLVRSKTDQVRAAATYGLALQLIAQADMMDVFQVRLETAVSGEARRQIAESLDKDFARETADRLRSRKSKALTDEAEQLLGTLVSNPRYAASEWPLEGRKIPLEELANRTSNAVRNLIPGKLAPATAGMDFAGSEVSLADHRGKVVLLIFSGHWCAPCRGLYPLENKLSRDYATRPFSLFGVNSDKSRDLLKKVIEAEKMTWPIIWDGGNTRGPLATKWNVKGWPLVVLIDHQGVIRYKFPGAPERSILTPLVDRLVREAETAAKGKSAS